MSIPISIFMICGMLNLLYMTLYSATAVTDAMAAYTVTALNDAEMASLPLSFAYFEERYDNIWNTFAEERSSFAEEERAAAKQRVQNAVME